ncbi:hypothetical protein V6N11_038637 [Hibiscus sabdariffa]|uniref:TF-B3 domain-containing protein n=1 Tax=Hibiscus sabdariffa TaxID=183260 RepID=A0ABR2SKM0_9ROSI
MKEDSVKLFILKPVAGESVLLVRSEFIVDVSWQSIHLQYWTLKAPHRCPPDFGRPEALLQATNSPQIPSVDVERTITEVAPVPPPDFAVRNASPNEVATPTTPGVVHQTQSSPAEIVEEDSVNSPDATKISRRKNGGKCGKGANKQTQVLCRLKSSLVPLFEKELTPSDADIKKGRLLLPKRCAEAFFPKISEQQGIFLTMEDTKGNAWELHFRFWTNTNGRMYFLEGLRECMALMQWAAGDTVTFYRREEDGKLVMGFKKYEAPKVVEKDSSVATLLDRFWNSVILSDFYCLSYKREFCMPLSNSNEVNPAGSMQLSLATKVMRQ